MITFIPLVVVTSLLLGTCVQSSALYDQDYYNHVTNHYGMITPENEGKYWFIQSYGWQPMDNIYQVAQDKDLQLHYHTLLWYYSLPDKPCEWIREVMERYPGIKSWDVVNEGWYSGGATSDLDIAAAYQCAREAMPDAQLWYNGIFDSEFERTKALGLLRDDLADGIGIQFHLTLDTDIAPMVETIREVEALHKPWRVSELDVRLQLPVSDSDLAKQRALYHTISELCHTSHHCQSITVWGSDDAHSWIGYQYPGWGSATPFTSDMEGKPLWEELTK